MMRDTRRRATTPGVGQLTKCLTLSASQAKLTLGQVAQPAQENTDIGPVMFLSCPRCWAVDRGLERDHFRGPKRATWVVAGCDQISGLGR